MRLWHAALFGWLAMAVAATANGIARVLILEPRLGARAAAVVSALSAIAILQTIAFLALRRHPATSRVQPAAIAAAWPPDDPCRPDF